MAGSAAGDSSPADRGSGTIAGANVQNLQFLVANDRDMGKSEPYDGVLTGSLFPQYDINFDFGGKHLSFLDPTTCTDPNQVAYWPHAAVAVIPMTIKNSRIVVPVTINGHSLDAVIDTGLPRTVMRRGVGSFIRNKHALHIEPHAACAQQRHQQFDMKILAQGAKGDEPELRSQASGLRPSMLQLNALKNCS